VEFKFNRGYKQNEVRETQTMMQKIDTLQKMRALGVDFDVELVKYMLPHLQPYIKGLKTQEEMMQQQIDQQLAVQPEGSAQSASPNKLSQGPATAARSAQKRTEASNSTSDRKQLGV
jgi:hypothetical protein